MSLDDLKSPIPEDELIGVVIDGSLRKGVEVRLDPAVSVEAIKEGTYVTIRGDSHWFFGMVTDVTLHSADPMIGQTIPDVSNALIRQVVANTVTYGTLSVLPKITMPPVLGSEDSPQPAKIVPVHFSKTYRASERDVEIVFGKEDRSHFYIGNPLDMETKVCLNVEELVKRSVGIFGKSGTGKTFLTRLLLVGMLQRDISSSLIFDMHNEYGWAGQDRDRDRQVGGLKQLFNSKVSIFTLDPESSIRRDSSYDFEVQVGFDEIEPEDVAQLQQTLGLSSIAADAAFDLERHLGNKRWLRDFLEMSGRKEVYELANSTSVNPGALVTLFNRLSRFKRFGFMKPKVQDDSVQRILEQLDRGIHVVLEFGRYGTDLTAYMLVANLLTRRIHQRYIQRMEAFEGGSGAEPRPLVICIEEAHRFLNPEVASQTIFGNIARELRKYNVTLMVIDQRPSGIDSEVMSQIGTKVSCLLDNERDIEATLAGTPGSRDLRSVLERLNAKQEALVFGHAVPLPVVIRTREYGAKGSYSDLTRPSWQVGSFQPNSLDKNRLEDQLKDLY